jgi:hypothetical protein
MGRRRWRSAPIIADLWLEFRWFAIPALWCIGRYYGFVWRKTYSHGGPWVAQYIVMAALSIYLVMQTMEAVIFRFLLMSVPIWTTWYAAQRVQFAAQQSWVPVYESIGTRITSRDFAR